ncbi:MAG: hypothetical protein AMXMBFR59_22520 [Rhodanobacteraceae bacterium]
MYQRSIPGNLSVGDIADLIADEEAGGSQFAGNQIRLFKQSGKPGAMRNVADFDVLDDAIPNRPTLMVKGGAAPAGLTLAWSGNMLVNGTSTVVELYRKSD